MVCNSSFYDKWKSTSRFRNRKTGQDPPLKFDYPLRLWQPLILVFQEKLAQTSMWSGVQISVIYFSGFRPIHQQMKNMVKRGLYIQFTRSSIKFQSWKEYHCFRGHVWRMTRCYVYTSSSRIPSQVQPGQKLLEEQPTIWSDSALCRVVMHHWSWWENTSPCNFPSSQDTWSQSVCRCKQPNTSFKQPEKTSNTHVPLNFIWENR